MYHTFFIHSSVDGHLGYFHVLAIVNSAAMNNGIYVSLSVLVSSGYMLRSGIARSYFPGGSERKIKESIQFTIATKRIQYLEITYLRRQKNYTQIIIRH